MPKVKSYIVSFSIDDENPDANLCVVGAKEFVDRELGNTGVTYKSTQTTIVNAFTGDDALYILKMLTEIAERKEEENGDV